MRLLLDTHIWIWALTKPGLLSRAVRTRLESPKSELFLSPVSVWEAGHLERKGKLKLKQGLTQSLDLMIKRILMREAPFNFAVASQACTLRLPQGDPGDIFLAAMALVFDLTLVTADAPTDRVSLAQDTGECLTIAVDNISTMDIIVV